MLCNDSKTLKDCYNVVFLFQCFLLITVQCQWFKLWLKLEVSNQLQFISKHGQLFDKICNRYLSNKFNSFSGLFISHTSYHIHSTVHIYKETFNKWPLNKCVPSLIHAELSLEILFLFVYKRAHITNFQKKVWIALMRIVY